MKWYSSAQLIQDHNLKAFKDIDVNYIKSIIFNKKLMNWLSPLRISETKQAYNKAYGYGADISSNFTTFLLHINDVYEYNLVSSFDRNEEIDYLSARQEVFSIIGSMYVQEVTLEDRTISLYTENLSLEVLMYLCDNDVEIFELLKCFENANNSDEFRYFCKNKQIQTQLAAIKICNFFQQKVGFDKSHSITKSNFLPVRTGLFRYVYELFKKLQEEFGSEGISNISDKFSLSDSDKKEFVNAMGNILLLQTSILERYQNQNAINQKHLIDLINC